MSAVVQGNNLLKNIPGLAAHQVRVPVRVIPFNREKADRMISAALGEISVYFTGEALAWLQINRPDVHGYLRESDREVEAAVLAGDWKRFMAALEKWTSAHRRAGSVFESRPPCIETQPELF